MSFAVDVNVNKSFRVDTTVGAAFDLLADVPKSVSHFPKVDRLADLGKNCYRWEMERIGLDRYFIQTVYACRYTSSKRDGKVQWEPIAGIGNADVAGRWILKRISENSVQVKLTTTARITVALPSLLRLLLAGLIENEFKSLIEQYISNLRATLEAGPMRSTGKCKERTMRTR